MRILTLNPRVPHPGLSPNVTSLRPLYPLEYNKGFKKPRGFWSFLNRASFNSATMAATAGEEAEVPPTSPDDPRKNILYRSPCAEISGKP